MSLKCPNKRCRSNIDNYTNEVEEKYCYLCGSKLAEPNWLKCSNCLRQFIHEGSYCTYCGFERNR